MTREHEKILQDVFPKIEKMMFDFMVENRKKSIGKREFSRRFEVYSRRMSSFPKERIPLVMLIQKIDQANDLIGYTKSLTHRTNRFSVNPLSLLGSIQKNALNEFETPIREVLVPMLDGQATLPSFRTTSGELPYSRVREILLPQVFMSVWTALESYLQDRIRVRVFSSSEEFSSFAGRVELRKLPGTWRESGKPVIGSDMSVRMQDLIDQYLQVFFGNLRKNGLAEMRYRQCFEIRISRYPKIGQLRKISRLRNTMVHEGTTWFGLSIIQLEYTWLRKFELLVLDFAEWVEDEIQRADTAKLREKRRT
jgi:hypothetical protein